MSHKKATFISIQGNIGSGKSTFIDILKKKHNMFEGKSVCFLPEPVDEWTKIVDKDGKNMIEKFYADQSKYSFSFQMMAYISRLKIIKDAYDSGLYDYIISERSLLTDKNVFAKMLYESGKMEDVDYQIYNKWFDTFNMFSKEEIIIYIHTSPEVAHQRVLKRARKGEEIPLEYLKKCSEYHDKWIEKEKDVIRLDGNVDIFEKEYVLQQWFDNIEHYMCFGY